MACEGVKTTYNLLRNFYSQYFYVIYFNILTTYRPRRSIQIFRHKMCTSFLPSPMGAIFTVHFIVFDFLHIKLQNWMKNVESWLKLSYILDVLCKERLSTRDFMTFCHPQGIILLPQTVTDKHQWQRFVGWFVALFPPHFPQIKESSIVLRVNCMASFFTKINRIYFSDWST